jgi:hypothetical protein
LLDTRYIFDQITAGTATASSALFTSGEGRRSTAASDIDCDAGRKLLNRRTLLTSSPLRSVMPLPISMPADNAWLALCLRRHHTSTMASPVDRPLSSPMYRSRVRRLHANRRSRAFRWRPIRLGCHLAEQFLAKFLTCAELRRAGLRISRTGAKPRLERGPPPPKHLRAPHCLDDGPRSTISMRPDSRNLFYARDLI